MASCLTRLWPCLHACRHPRTASLLASYCLTTQQLIWALPPSMQAPTHHQQARRVAHVHGGLPGVGGGRSVARGVGCTLPHMWGRGVGGAWALHVHGGLPGVGELYEGGKGSVGKRCGDSWATQCVRSCGVQLGVGKPFPCAAWPLRSLDQLDTTLRFLTLESTPTSHLPHT